ncbi:MAG: polyprenyl diphosphate synthase [Candidatus Saccharibacteria bacterium]
MADSNHQLQHIAFIPDGNRRWAKANGFSINQAYKRGYEQLRVVAQACFDRNIPYFSAFVFSSENWQRASDEVGILMKMALKVVLKDAKELHKKNVRLRIVGSREKISDKLKAAIEEAEELTKNNTAGTFLACFNYGGRQEIVDSLRAIVRENIHPDDINDEVITKHLYCPEVPAPDLIVRTSGEKRLSNFLLWQSAYSEFAFVDEFWPEFDETRLDAVLTDYANRGRRFGK